MNGLKDLLKKKDSITKDAQQSKPAVLAVPEFRIIRTTTESEEVIEPPHFDGDDVTPAKEQKKERRRTLFSRSPSASTPRNASASKTRSSLDSDDTKKLQSLPVRPKNERKLSERLHMGGRSRSKTNENTSSHLPENLPAAPDSVSVPSIRVDGKDEGNKYANAQREAQWEKRATILASAPSLLESEDRTGRARETINLNATPTSRDRSRSISDQEGDVNIQEAIRLHEAGDLSNSTNMFGQLADPKGANNALSQVLYGLALRHGWGIPPEPDKAIHYLSLAASNSAAVEQAALASGMTKGGAAKGELVLAIFELANCFRYAWGVKKDPVAARQYYETAANLGDTDALDEAAWCYLEGFGGPKDKVCSMTFHFVSFRLFLVLVGRFLRTPRESERQFCRYWHGRANRAVYSEPHRFTSWAAMRFASLRLSRAGLPCVLIRSAAQTGSAAQMCGLTSDFASPFFLTHSPIGTLRVWGEK